MRGELPPGLIDGVLALSEDVRLELMLAPREMMSRGENLNVLETA